jgi:hypothetical protein
MCHYFHRIAGFEISLARAGNAGELAGHGRCATGLRGGHRFHKEKALQEQAPGMVYRKGKYNKYYFLPRRRTAVSLLCVQ